MSTAPTRTQNPATRKGNLATKGAVLLCFVVLNLIIVSINYNVSVEPPDRLHELFRETELKIEVQRMTQMADIMTAYCVNQTTTTTTTTTNNNNNNKPQNDQLNVWPLPKHYEVGGATYTLSSTLFEHVQITCKDVKIQTMIGVALERMKTPVASQDVHLTSPINRMKINLDETYSIPAEGYELSITPSEIIVKAIDYAGALYALQTLFQLIVPCQSVAPDVLVYLIRNVPIEIKDSPQFPYRGMLLDTARNYYTMDFIKKLLDVLHSLKMNRLHWHLTDNEGFSFLVEAHPKHMAAQKDTKRVYTQREMRDIVEYAAKRAIVIMPELDMPSHSASWGKYYHEVAADRVADCEIYHSLNPSSEMTYQLARDFIKEFNDIFPGNFMHLGGDELRPICWENDKQLVHNMTALLQAGIYDDETLFNHKWIKYEYYFWSRVGEFAGSLLPNKFSVFWDEWFTLPHAKVWPMPTVIEVWRGTKNLEDAAQRGYRVINAYGWYFNKAPEGCTTWQSCYKRNIYEIFPLSGGAPQILKESLWPLVLGGEGAAWELTQGAFDMVVWQKLIAISERLWYHSAIRGGALTTPNVMQQIKTRYYAEVERLVPLIGVIAVEDDDAPKPKEETRS